MRTGGDADFCLRAAGTGARLVYTPDAIVDHPARQSTAALITKARRIAGGAPRVRELQGRTKTPTVRLTGAPYRRAREAGHRVGPVWGVRASVIDYRLQRIMRAAFRG